MVSLGGKNRIALARSLRAALAAGSLAVHVPALLFLEIVNVAGRRWNWQWPQVVELARTLRALVFEV